MGNNWEDAGTAVPGSGSTGWDVFAVGQSPSLELCGLMCCNTVARCRAKSSSSGHHSKI